MNERSSDPGRLYLAGPGGEAMPARSWLYGAGVWIFLVAVTLCLGATGFVLSDVAALAPLHLLDVLYRAVQLFFLNYNPTTAPISWQLEAARWMAPALAGYAIYKGLESVLHERFQRLGVLLRYRDHVILCGLGRKAVRLATAYRQQGRRVVMIEKDPKHPMIDVCRERGMAVLVGDARSPIVLRQAQLARAERLIALSGDLTNLEIAFEAERVLAKSAPAPRALPCFVHVEDSVVCRNLRDAEAGRHRSLVVRDYFNIDEIAARALVNWERCPALPAEIAGPWHLVVVGLGPTGLALVLEAARRWSGRPPAAAEKEPLWITVVDRQASVQLALLAKRFPWLMRDVQIKSPQSRGT